MLTWKGKKMLPLSFSPSFSGPKLHIFTLAGVNDRDTAEKESRSHADDC